MKITLVHSAALGDTVLLLPLLRALAARFPGCETTLVTRPAFGQMFVMRGWAHAWASADDPVHTRWFADGGTPPSVWANCDLLISAVSNGKDAWAAHAAASSARRVAYFDPRPPSNHAGHVAAFHRQQLADLELPEAPPMLPLANPDGALLIHPGSGGEAKCWPREKFVALGQDLLRNGIRPCFLLGEAEQERWGAAAIRQLQDQFDWYLHMGLYELSERMSRARIYLGNDSGVTHLAAAVGVPTLALFGPSDEQQWGPVGPAVRVLRSTAGDGRDLATLEEADVLAALLGEMRVFPHNGT
jgi:ADP-heptose:LPS heptosyltransferase